jgi:pSer/pThr/pTyr-binding forkhead associated (FHA) protein
MSDEMPPPPVPARARPLVKVRPITAARSTWPQIPYEPPHWAKAGGRFCCFEVLRGGLHIDTVRLRSANPANLFVTVGRADCDIVCAHASVSRYHAVLQFGSPENDPNVVLATKLMAEPVVMYIFDLGSTHGTRINKRVIPVKKFVAAYEGDHVVFGESSRIYVVASHEENPTELSVAIVSSDTTPLSYTPPARPPKKESKKAVESQRKKEAIMMGLDVKAAKRDGFLSEIEFIEAKASTQELTPGQLRQIQALSLKVEKLEAEIETQSDILRNEEDTFVDGDDDGVPSSRHVLDVETETDDVEDQTDVAKNLNQMLPVSLVSELRTTETSESLIAKLEGLAQIVESRSRELLKFAQLQGPNGQSTTRGDCNEDSLDAFMAQNEHAIVNDQRAKALRAYAAASEEYKRVKRMAALAMRGSDMLDRVPTGAATSNISFSEGVEDATFFGKVDCRPEKYVRGSAAPEYRSEALTSKDILVASRPGKRQRLSNESDSPVSSGGEKRNATSQIYVDDDGGEYNWVPPAGQRGDGKSELNVKYGY